MQKHYHLLFSFLLAFPIILITNKHKPTRSIEPNDIHMHHEPNDPIRPKENPAPICIDRIADKKIEPELEQGSDNNLIATQDNMPPFVHDDRTIIIKNNITKKMITYTKCFIPYTPSFCIYVNDKILKQGQQCNVPIKDNKITITYCYNFLNGYKKGSKAVEFTIPASKQELEITFSWHNNWRIIVPDAKPINVIQLS